MNKDQKAVLFGSGVIALAIVAHGFIISYKLSKALDEKNFWEGSNIPQVASDVHRVTQPIAQITENVLSWTRA